MTYAMTLDNAWELMTEDEMYDVNGGGLYIELYNIMMTENLRKALFGASVTLITSLVTSAILAALGVSGVGAALAGAIIGTAVAFATSIIADTSIKGDVVIASIPIGVGFNLWFSGSTKVVKTSYVGW
ncbi:MAG: hypothetical protein RBQ97_10995 [Acholeplasma sp.]|jgi:hypothetical protein|nr:hypothetical protein [Acholeplasma sp.]